MMKFHSSEKPVRSAGSRGPAGLKTKFKLRRKKVCRLCSEHLEGVDYKDVEHLLKFSTEKGKILPRRISGNCAMHQRKVARAFKRSRHAALVPFQIIQ